MYNSYLYMDFIVSIVPYELIISYPFSYDTLETCCKDKQYIFNMQIKKHFF